MADRTSAAWGAELVQAAARFTGWDLGQEVDS